MDIAEKLRPYLTSPISEDTEKLRSLRVELAEAVVEARQKLLEKRRQMLWPKDKDMTELDRKTRLEADIAVYERNYDFLKSLEEIAVEKIALNMVYNKGKP